LGNPLGGKIRLHVLHVTGLYMISSGFPAHGK
jgi:hypothetical protein